MKPQQPPCVYFVYCAGLIKIGFATDLAARLGSIACNNPHPATALWTIPGDRKLEREFHSRFAEWRSGGEWFEFAPPIRQFLRERLSTTVGGIARMNRVEQEFLDWARAHFMPQTEAENAQ